MCFLSWRLMLSDISWKIRITICARQKTSQRIGIHWNKIWKKGGKKIDVNSEQPCGTPNESGKRIKRRLKFSISFVLSRFSAFSADDSTHMVNFHDYRSLCQTFSWECHLRDFVASFRIWSMTTVQNRQVDGAFGNSFLFHIRMSNIRCVRRKSNEDVVKVCGKIPKSKLLSSIYIKSRFPHTYNINPLRTSKHINFFFLLSLNHIFNVISTS